jgi:UDP-glucose 6-dehydrogenase
MESLVHNKFTGLIIIKSSVLYIDIKKYNEILKIAYWAEFLNDLTAEEDFLKDTCPLIGCENFIKNEVVEILKTNFKHLTDFKFDTIENALNFKFIRNSYIAWKITFWNMIAQHSLMDQRTIKGLMEQYPISEVMDIAVDGKVGFGGKCLPKDFQALTQIVDEKIFIDILKWNKNLRTPNHTKNTIMRWLNKFGFKL